MSLDNYQRIAQFLVSHGYRDVAAAGICGCIAGESGGDPEAVQVPGNPNAGGAGLIQWTPASSMVHYGGTCRAAGISDLSDSEDMDHQLNAILGYNNANGTELKAQLDRQPSPVAAADFYSRYFERPAVLYSDVRAAVAQDVYAWLTENNFPTIDEGDFGPAVEKAQERLNIWKVTAKPLSVDGDFGPLTHDAVGKFQQDHHIDGGGCVVGSRTWPKLMKVPPA